MFLEIITIAVIIGLLRGGTLSNLKNLDLRFINLIFAAFLIQAGIDYWGTRYPWGGYPYLHIASYFFLFYALYRNWQIPGMKLLLFGTLLNFVVIVFNEGVMPVRADVLSENAKAALEAGLGGTHGIIDQMTRFKFLADILYFPLPYVNQLLSIGDLVLDAGILVILICGMGKRARI